MSRLEDLISRFTAQKTHLDRAFSICHSQPGLALEVGLGSGRTFDHLRENLPDHQLFAFDYRVETHPGCEPSESQQVLGDISKTLPKFANDHTNQAILIHLDIGTKKYKDDIERYKKFIPSVFSMLMKGGVLVSDRPVEHSHLKPLPDLKDQGSWKYFSYSKVES